MGEIASQSPAFWHASCDPMRRAFCCGAILPPEHWEALLCVHHALAVAAVVIIAVGVKLPFSPPIKAEADITPAVTMNVLQMQSRHPNLPIQKMSDMTFVFADEN